MTKCKNLKRYGKHRSIVRWIGSFMPLKAAPRISFHVVNPRTKHVILAHSGNADGFSTSFNSNVKPDLLQFSHCEPRRRSDNIMTHKLDNLEKELQELREQMVSIISAQLKAELQKVAVTPAIVSTATTKPGIPPPPPLPPPPPPPLPPPSLPFSANAPLRKSNNTLENTPKLPKASKPSSKIGHPLDMGEVLKDLNKVKLRRIERSPGGTPVRSKHQSTSPSDPNTALMSVLRKRFAAINVRSPGKPTACDLDDSQSDSNNSNSLVI